MNKREARIFAGRAKRRICVETGRLSEYQVNMMVTFVLEDYTATAGSREALSINGRARRSKSLYRASALQAPVD